MGDSKKGKIIFANGSELEVDIGTIDVSAPFKGGRLPPMRGTLTATLSNVWADHELIESLWEEQLVKAAENMVPVDVD